jgi:hypothetical protein
VKEAGVSIIEGTTPTAIYALRYFVTRDHLR